ncbi:MAG: tRNA-dihydrouridine synthase [Candidatus Pacebacteria bacterium]|nr:tRNA-dihydrouridine synthase [Candidatus Paceibacterota bacterium]
MKNNFWQQLEKPIIALAPMAGVNDLAFRHVCKSFGADVIYSEMASATALARNPEKTLKMLEFEQVDRPYVIQIFGSKVEDFSPAVKRLEKELDFDGIDINFGCPVNKVIKQGAGAILMQEKLAAKKIIAKTLEVASLPVSIKTRIKSGEVEVLDFLKYIQDLPVSALMIHGRSLSQGFVGEIDYRVIKKARKYFSGIILANGGINNYSQAEKTLKLTRSDGLGIARGALGRPWLFKEIKEGKELELSLSEIASVALKQTKLAYKYRQDSGIKEMRKHLAWYMQNFPGAKNLRNKLIKVESLKDVETILKNI